VLTDGPVNRVGRPRPSTVRVGLMAGIVLVALATVLAERPFSDRHGPAQSTDSSAAGSSLAMNPERKYRAAQITSSFENSTLELQYDYVENIGDGRGLTAGRAGFTSATGDLLLMVRRYSAVKSDNVLVPYLPALEAVNGTDSVQGLDGFPDAWAEAADDPDFRELQDQLVDELYFDPAMKMAADVGVETALGQLVIWDTMIQHGAGGRHGTRSIIKDTEEIVGTVGQSESAWLDAFLDARLRHLLRMYPATTKDADVSSESRVDALRSLLHAGDLALEPPLTWEVYGDRFGLPARDR
jgi:chitosanase